MGKRGPKGLPFQKSPRLCECGNACYNPPSRVNSYAPAWRTCFECYSRKRNAQRNAKRAAFGREKYDGYRRPDATIANY